MRARPSIRRPDGLSARAPDFLVAAAIFSAVFPLLAGAGRASAAPDDPGLPSSPASSPVAIPSPLPSLGPSSSPASIPALTPSSTSPLTQPEPQVVPGKLAGRVFERGSSTALSGATVEGAGQSAVTDDEGAFSLVLPAGEVEVVVSAARHEPLVLRERITPHQQLNVTYGLLLQPKYRQAYHSVVRGEARHEGERFTLRDEELRQLPGALGDPFRAVMMLPGVSTPLPGLPLYVVRGASPGMNGFFLDGMRVPQLFHFLIGGGVVHPDLVDRIDFYPGSYDASFGRYAGGIIDATTRPARSDAPLHGEAELRFYDLSAMVETHPIKDSDLRVEAAGHFGYPGPLIHLIQPGVDLTYWDYQARADWHGLTLEALGSYDQVIIQRSLFQPTETGSDEYHLMFHRVQLRDQVKRGRLEAEVALVAGYDEMRIFGNQGVRKLSLAARAIGRLNLGWLRLQAGLDGELSQFTPQNFSTTDSGAAPDELGDLAGDRTGITASAYVEGTLVLDRFVGRPLSINAGVRADTYHAGDVTLLGVDPRVVIRFEPQKWLAFHAGFGLYQQPPSFPVPLPGIDTFALQLGLQRALQGSVGLTLKLPFGVSLAATGYYQRFYNMTDFDINDVLAAYTETACASQPPESLSGYAALITREVNGAATGLELMLRKETGRVTGWIAYTLGRSERAYACGLRPSDYDQTHVLNAVVQVRLPWRLVAGAHFQFASGRPYTALNYTGGAPSGDTVNITRNNARLPDYFQLDLRVDREWYFKRYTVGLFIEVVNLTYSESILGVVDYPTVNGITRYDQPQLEGFHFILPSVGLKVKF